MSGIPATVAEGAVPCTIQFDSANYRVAENAGAVKLNVTLSQTYSRVVCAAIKVIDGTAKNGVDYLTATPLCVSIPAGKINRIIEIPIIDNGIDDTDRSFQVSIYSSCNAAIGSPGTATVTILDDEVKPTIQFTRGDYEVGESDGEVTLGVSLETPMPDDVVVHYRTHDQTAKDNVNFAGTSDGTITFPAGSSTDQQIVIDIKKDDKYSGDPQFSVELFSVSSGNAIVGTPGTATVTIDEEMPGVEFTRASYTVSEDAGKVALGVRLSEPSTISAIVNYSTQDGSARSPEDYTEKSATVTIPAMQREGTFDVLINNDQEYESPETFGAGINGITINGVDKGIGSSVGVTIVEDDPLVSLSASTYTVAENAGKVSIGLVLSHASSHAVTVYLGTGGGNATRGEDYDDSFDFDSPYRVVIPAGQSSKTVDVSIVDDNVRENDVYFNVGIGSAYYAGIGTPQSATVTIQDDEPVPSIAFTQAGYVVDEDGVNAVLDVMMSGASPTQVAVQYKTADDTAVDGINYTGTVSGTIIFPAGTNLVRQITVPILDDAIFGGDTQFAVELTEISAGIAVLGSPAIATVTIEDDDKPTVRFETDEYTVGEGDSYAHITVVLSAPCDMDMYVWVGTSSGTAIGVDHTAPSQITRDYTYNRFAQYYPLKINAGEETAVFDVAIEDDDLVEEDEYFTVHINEAYYVTGTSINDYSGRRYIPAGEPSTATVTILDNEDWPEVSFARADYDVEEGDGKAYATVTLSHAWDRDVYVWVGTSGGTAIGVDHTAPSQITRDYTYNRFAQYYPLKIGAGELTAIFDVDIEDDQLDEGDEYFSIHINEAYFITGTSINDRLGHRYIGTVEPATATVTIHDNDGLPEVALARAEYEVGEGDGSMVLDVSLSKAADSPVVVCYRTVDGTAKDDVNYTGIIDGTITFPAGSTVNQKITVPILDDAIYGGDTLFFVNLTGISSGNAVVRSPDVAQVTVQDDEQTFTVQLTKGWNMISSPLVIEEFKVSTIQSLCPEITQVMRYDTTGKKYTSFVIGSSPAFLDFDFRTDEGYLVYCSGDSSITFAGKRPADRTVDLVTGWNMVGWSTLETSDTITVTTLKLPAGLQQIMTYDTATQEYKSYVEGSSPAFLNYQTSPGSGFLIYSDTNTRLDYGGI